MQIKNMKIKINQEPRHFLKVRTLYHRGHESLSIQTIFMSPLQIVIFQFGLQFPWLGCQSPHWPDVEEENWEAQNSFSVLCRRCD